VNEPKRAEPESFQAAIIVAPQVSSVVSLCVVAGSSSADGSFSRRSASSIAPATAGGAAMKARSS
jgi:hypothetical protein